MAQKQDIINELINTFAEAYHNLGYSSLMGKIVALLLSSKEPLSLDEISERLQMSKGPISQISRKLKEHQLIERVWIPGERKDYYRASDDIFGQAFKNYSRSMRKNEHIAQHFLQITNQNGSQDTDLMHLTERMQEMKEFYAMMTKHHAAFIEEWKKTKQDYKPEPV
jgi:DNA-binding transcriptional regulator GbsR (MarR family)